MLEPLIGYAMKGTNDDGIRIPDFTKFEGRLAESGSMIRRAPPGRCICGMA